MHKLLCSPAFHRLDWALEISHLTIAVLYCGQHYSHHLFNHAQHGKIFFFSTLISLDVVVFVCMCQCPLSLVTSLDNSNWHMRFAGGPKDAWAYSIISHSSMRHRMRLHEFVGAASGIHWWMHSRAFKCALPISSVWQQKRHGVRIPVTSWQVSNFVGKSRDY